MDNRYYIVMVQDYGEVYEYEFPNLEKARYLMSVEQLACSLWECTPLSSQRKLLESKNSARAGETTTSALWGEIRMSPTRSRVMPRPMRLPRMSRWVSALSAPWKAARRNASSPSVPSAQSG